MTKSLMTSIKTERLLLRPHKQSDLADLHIYSADPEVVKFMQWGPNTEQQSRDFLSNCIAGQSIDEKQNYDFAVELVDNSGFPEARAGQMVGSISLRLPKPDAKLGEIGYCYARSTWGKGVASEAAEAVMKFGFEDLGLHKISATCDPFNFGSAKVLQKAGMRLEGFLKKHIYIKGIWRDTLLFGTAREDQAQNKVLYSNSQSATNLQKLQGQNGGSGKHGVQRSFVVDMFAQGEVIKIELEAGAELKAHTPVLDEYCLVLEGTLTAGDETWGKNTLVHTPMAVQQKSLLAKEKSTVILFRLGPDGADR